VLVVFRIDIYKNEKIPKLRWINDDENVDCLKVDNMEKEHTRWCDA